MVNGNENGSQGEAFRLPPIHKLVSDVAPASEILGSLRYRRHNDNPVKAAQQGFGSDRDVLKGSACASSPSRKGQSSQPSNPDMYLGTRSGVEGSTGSGSGASSASGSSSCDNDELREDAQAEGQRYNQEQEEKEYQEEPDVKNNITESNLSGGSSSERSEFASRSPQAPGFSFTPFSRSIDAESTTEVPGLNKSFISGKATSDKPYLKEFDDDPRNAFMSDGENNDTAPFPGERRRHKVAKIKKTSTPSSTHQRDLTQDDSQRHERHERHEQHDLQHDLQNDTQQTTQHEARQDRGHAIQHDGQEPDQLRHKQEQKQEQQKERELGHQLQHEQAHQVREQVCEQKVCEHQGCEHEQGHQEREHRQGTSTNQDTNRDTNLDTNRDTKQDKDTNHDANRDANRDANPGTNPGTNHDNVKEEEYRRSRRLSNDSFSNLQPLEPQPKAQDGIHFSQIPVYSFMHVSPPKAEDSEGKSRYGAANEDAGNKHILSGNTPNAAFSSSPQPLPQLPPWISSMKQLQTSEPNSAISNNDTRSPTGASGPNPYDSLNGISISSPRGASHSREHSHSSSVFEATPYGAGVPNSAPTSGSLAGSVLDSSSKSPSRAMYSGGQAQNMYPRTHTPQPGQFYYPYSHYPSLPAVVQYANAQYPGANSRNNLMYSAANASANAQPQLMMQHAQLSASFTGCQAPPPSHMGHLQSPQMPAYAPQTQVPMQSLPSQHKYPLADVKQETGGPDGGGKPLSSAMNGHQPQLAKEHTFQVAGGNNSSHPEFHIIDSATGRHLVAEAPRRRGNLPKDVTNVLRAWLSSHLGNPYPTEDDKLKLVEQTGLSMIQVSNWFINARRRSIPATQRKSKYSHYRPEADKSNFQHDSEKRKLGEKDKKKPESD